MGRGLKKTERSNTRCLSNACVAEETLEPYLRNLRIVLKQERKPYVLEEPIPEEPPAIAPKAQKDAYTKHINDSTDVSYLMLGVMISDLQKDLEEMEAYDMLAQLKTMFQEQARQERFRTTKALNSCKMTPGTPVSAHVLKMKSYIHHLEKLGGNSGSKVQLEEIQVSQNDIEPEKEIEVSSQAVDEQPSTTQGLCRSDRIRHEPERYGFLVTDDDNVMLIDHNEPTTYQEAMESLESAKWLEAMKAEMQSMYDNQVWTLIDPSDGLKTIGCKWVFKKKLDMDGNVHTYKERLVAKGYRQAHGIDYDETFSPVVMIKSIRILIAIAAYYDYEI
ncbi:hypothetical protein K2173_022829 [Erythroxylum novogranatense]|uniref:Reverse transcriptase Ty1/copia-type domain-containing protein n=1 Tax=Erythroxylum novogranatense TaxID=1862640 RepID=A0AAV8SNR0_9ROSI|nr:hypothetical protein K2173_022829 [Erythroxylum novogranatense]